MEVRFTLYVYSTDTYQRLEFISSIMNSFDVYFKGECDRYNFYQCEILSGATEYLEDLSGLLPLLQSAMAIIDIDYDGEGGESVFVVDGKECDEIEFYDALLNACPRQALLAGVQRNNFKVVSAANSAGVRIQDSDEFVIKLAIQGTLRIAKIILKEIDSLDKDFFDGIAFRESVRKFINKKYSLNIEPRKSWRNLEENKSFGDTEVYLELEKISEDMVCTILEKRGIYPFLINQLDALLQEKRYMRYVVSFASLAEKTGMVNECKLRKSLMNAGVSIDFSSVPMLWSVSKLSLIDFASFQWILSERNNQFMADDEFREKLHSIACLILSKYSWLDSACCIKIDKGYLLKLTKSRIHTLLFDSGFFGEIIKTWSLEKHIGFERLTKQKMVNEVLSYNFDWLPYEQMVNEIESTYRKKLAFLLNYIDLKDSMFICVLASDNHGMNIWGYKFLIDRLEVDVENNGGNLNLLEKAIAFRRYAAVGYLLENGLNVKKTFLNKMTLSEYLNECKIKDDKVMVNGKKRNYFSVLQHIFKEHGCRIH